MKTKGLVSWFVVLVSLLAAPLWGETVIEAWRSPAGMFVQPAGISVDSSDGSCWVFDDGSWDLVRLSRSGRELLRIGDFYGGAEISASSLDGSCWLTGQVASHISAGGEVLLEGYLYDILAASSYDGSCWTATYTGLDDYVRHLSANGQVLWESEQYSFSLPHSLSCNASDGSCWVANEHTDEVVHLAGNGEELLRLGRLNFPHFQPLCVSVDSSDNSCWVGGIWVETGYLQVLHISENGDELGRGEYLVDIEDGDLSASPSDGTCWVSDRWDDRVLHLSGTAEVLWESDQYRPIGVSANAADGSCWVSDRGNGRVVHLVIAGEPTFSDVPVTHWAFYGIEACVSSGVVVGYPDGTYLPDLPVSRAAMAVYISRALAGGDANVPFGPETPTFEDVPTNHWAYKYIEYCKAHDVVQGFTPTTYAPDVVVNRAQMAAYIARAVAGGDSAVPDGPATPSFSDVATDHWAYDYVEYCKAHSIVLGYTQDDPGTPENEATYAPDLDVTRDQMAVYVARAFELPI